MHFPSSGRRQEQNFYYLDSGGFTFCTRLVTPGNLPRKSSLMESLNVLASGTEGVAVEVLEVPVSGTKGVVNENQWKL